MATVTITFRDKETDGRVEVLLGSEPPIQSNEEMTPAHRLAAIVRDLLDDPYLTFEILKNIRLRKESQMEGLEVLQ